MMLEKFWNKKIEQTFLELMRNVVRERRKRILDKKALQLYSKQIVDLGFHRLKSFYKKRKEIRNDKILWRAATTNHEFFNV